jgi:hypothetical protein
MARALAKDLGEGVTDDLLGGNAARLYGLG